MTAKTRNLSIVLLAAALSLAGAVLGGCEARMPSNSFLDPSPTMTNLVQGYAVTSQPDSVATSRPDAAVACGDLDQAIALVSDLHYAKARRLLLNLEGQLLLARNLRRAPEAAFWLAYCDEKLGLTEQACDEYRLLVQRYPDFPQAGLAAERLAHLRPVQARPAGL